jgi:hypothetical protein
MGSVSIDTNLSTAVFTGNSQFVISGSSIYVVANTTQSGQLSVYESTNSGVSFSLVGTLNNVTESAHGFDPAVAIDASGNLWILGTVYSGLSASLAVFLFNTTNNTFVSSSPFFITSNSQIGRDYDIAILSDGTALVAASLLNASGIPTNLLPANFYGEAILALHINSLFVIDTFLLDSSPFRTGNTYGTVSVLANSTGAEVYVGAHPKVVSFANVAATISLFQYNLESNLFSSSVINTIQARYMDDRMTIIGNGTDRYLSQCFFTQSRTALIGNALLGYSANSGSTWSWFTFPGSNTASITDPVISVTPENQLAFSYVQKNFSSSVGTMSGQLVVTYLSVSPWAISEDPTFYNTIITSRIRGTKNELLSGMGYALMGESVDGIGTFYTGLQVPPVAVIIPPTVTLNRGETFTLSAADSYSANGDPMTMTWSSSSVVVQVTPLANAEGVETQADIYTPPNTGPAEQTVTISVIVETLDLEGNPIFVYDPSSMNPAILAMQATCIVTIPFDPPPVIGPFGPVTVDRGTIVTLSPVVTDSAPNALVYSWAQTAGTIVDIGETDGPSLQVNTNGALFVGETLVFTLTVDDGVNTPVSRDFDIIVVTYTLSEPNTFINRGTWSGSIASRNTAGVYSTDESCIVSSLNDWKKFTMIDSENRTVVVTPTDVMVFSYTGVSAPIDTRTVVLRRFFPPVGVTVLDGLQTEDDYTLMLGSDQNLYKYTTAPAINSDSWDAVIALDTLTSMQFNKIFTTYSYANVRVLALIGPDGCFLLQLNNEEFTPITGMEISPASKLLFGGADVLWVRMNNVESVQTGKIYLGTLQNGNTYETLVDLSTHRILGTWSASNLHNKIVQSGEILFEAESTYMGFPSPPVITGFQIQAASNFIVPVTISWTVNRPDLVTEFQIQTSNNGGTNWVQQPSVTKGEQTTVTLSLGQGYTYLIEMNAINPDGTSSWSIPVSVSI